ncbi:hemagglutinin repeat-containing protein [Paraburkholderia jirisanensis]
MLTFAQVVAGGAHAPNVIQTPNGLDQVNINRPSGAGVSDNTYNQFDVQQKGAILNNSPVIVQTQQAGMINGNPNFAAGQSAKIIVNQVNSPTASQLNGYLEVAGKRAEVILANPSGISVNGGGFINTSRAILATGAPNYAADGSISGFNVTSGNITVNGAGLNASNVDQVDLLSRAVQANAAIHAKNLNVVTGANRIDHDTLNATPIAGDGPAPYVSIDVSQLGGMYANRIFLVGTEAGVGVSLKGVVAANAGDLVLTAQGKLELASQSSASGNVNASARDGIDNSGTTYAQQSVSLNTSGTLANSGMVAAQQNTAISAASVDSTGTLASGVNGDGLLAQSGDLNVSASGAVTTTGSNVAGGNANVSGATLNLSGSTTSAGGTIALAANSGDLNLSGATTTAGGTLEMRANGTLTNDNGVLSSGSGQTVTAGALSNRGGRIAAGASATIQSGSLANNGGSIVAPDLAVATGSTLDNSGGDIEANQLALNATDLLNHAGTITQYGVSPMGFTVSGTFDNSNGGTFQTNSTDLTLAPGTLINDGGTILDAGTGTLTIAPGNGVGFFSNVGGQINTAGQLAARAGSLNNTSGVLAAQGNIVANVAGDVNNTQGAIRSLSSLSLASDSTLTNTNGQIAAAHDLSVNAAALTGGGAYSAANDVAIRVQGDFAPTPDLRFAAGHDLSFTLPGTFSNGATLEAVNNLGINAGDIANRGLMMAGGTLTTHSNTLENTGAMVGGSVSLNANRAISNVGPTALIGATDSDGTLELLAHDIENRDGDTTTDTQATTAIYGLGKVVLAGGKNTDGSYTHASLIRNQSGLIESAADMELHASQVTNTRTTMTTTGLNQPVDPTLLDELDISLSGRTGQVGVQDPNSIGGVYTEPPHGGQWNSTYQYTTYTGVVVANLIASISPQAQIIAGGNLDASNVGLFQNYWSAVAAAGNIAAPVSLDQNSWQGQTAPNVRVTYSGEYHYNNYDNTEHDWRLPFGDAPFVGARPGGYTQAAPADIRYYALPSYESSFVAGGALSGSGISIDNTAGNAGIPSIGLAPGQAMSGVNVNGLSGNANATAQNVLQNLTVPQGGLFGPATAPGASWLVETNPAFTNQKTFVSSDYYLRQLGLNPQTTEKRLGDGFYEQQLVRNQITALTGKAVLGPYTDLQSMYEALLAAGASLAQSLNLPLGMSLSAEQVAALTSNIVIMQTEVVDGQSVLVPVIYLARASQQNMNGPLIAATDIDFQNARTFTNSGTVQAGNTLSIQGNQISNAFGTLQSGGLMSLTTKGNVDLTSATVKAGSLALKAGGDLLLNTAVKTVDQVSATGATRTTSTLGPIANVNVKGDAVISTGGDVEQNAGNLNVGGNLGMAVGGNYDIGSVQTGEHKVVERANGVSNTSFNQTTGSSVNVGGVSQIGVGGDLTATGASLNLAGGGTLAANGNVTLQAAKATSTTDSNSSGSDSHGSYSESLHRSDDTLTATTLNAGNSLTVVSGKDINVTGSAIGLDKGTATLAAAGNVNIGATMETHVENSQEQHKHSNVVSGKEVHSSREITTTLSQGSMVSADAVAIASGKDINVTGSTIVGTNDVALSAAHDVNIVTSRDTMQSSGSYQEKRTGLGTSGLTLTVGTNTLATTDQKSSVTSNASTVGSINGNLSIQAGNTLHVTGSDLVAGQNLTGTAANVLIDAATDTAHQAQTQKTSSSGLTIGLAGSVGDAINNAYSETRAASHSSSSGNDRAAVLHSIAAAGDVAIVGAGAASLAAGGKPDIGIKVSIGSSKSQSQSSEDQATQRASSVQAGGTAAFLATGGDVTIAGSNVSANDVVLAAKDKVNVINTTDTDSTRSSNSSSSASIGVQYTVGGGFGVSAAMANAHGDANSDASIQNASHVAGTNSVTVISGGDTNIIGSQINGKQIVADVGGNLSVASVQDVTNSAAHQSSAGGGFTISQGGGSASFSAQNGHADGNYAGVNEQAGIRSGDGGFAISVKGNTDLKGAVIASEADASKNTLATGTLTFSDVENHSHYSATSNGLSVGGGIGSTGKASGPGSVGGSGGLIPMMTQNESGDTSATTRSAVSAGTINVTNASSQTQDVAGLSRDTADTNDKVANTPDVNSILNQQADTMQAAQAAAQSVAQGIGAYADTQQKAAQDQADAAKATGNTDLAAQYQAVADSWNEGGTNRVGLHVAGGALVAGLGGGGIGSAAQGAVGAGTAAILAGKINGVADSVGDATGSMTAGNIAANVLAGLGGAIMGAGTAGAFAASNADLYNRSTGNEKGMGGTGSEFIDNAKNTGAGVWNGLVTLAEMGINLPNGGPFAAPNDPGYVTLDSARLPYTSGDQIGPAVEFFAAALVTKGVGKGAVADAEAAAMGDAAAFKKGIDATSYQGTMLGTDGARVASKTVWKGTGQERIDVENPAPGVRPGQIHYQDNGGSKYYYDPNTQVFFDQRTGDLAPRNVQNLLQDPSFSKAISKALNGYLGAK